MAKYRKKPVVIEAITFTELIEYGKVNCANIVKGMPWAFRYNGYPVSHETDECYIITTMGGTLYMKPTDMLITGFSGEIQICKLNLFRKIYEKEEE